MGFARKVINENEEDCMTVTGYRRNLSKFGLTWICICLSAGILGVIFYWRKDWYLRVTSDLCSMSDADALILEDVYKELFVSRVHDMAKHARFYAEPPLGAVNNSLSIVEPSNREPGYFEAVPILKYFDCKRVRYVWDTSTQSFKKLHGISDVKLGYFGLSKGLDDNARSQRLKLFGLNVIAVKVDPIIKILFKEALTPFYAFQLFSVVLWFTQPYYAYAGVIVGISLLSLSSQVFETRRQQLALHKRVQDHDFVRVQKVDGSVHTVPSSTLVPGDIIILDPKGGKIVYDALLLSGNCIVNESSLTGESVPVPKIAVSLSDANHSFDMKSHNRGMLFCGTSLLQARPGSDGLIRAVVIRTGYMTSKGELIRSIMFFRRVDFAFQNQTYWYIGALACIAVLGMIYSFIIKLTGSELQRQSTRDVIIKSLDLVTIVIPPALPAAVTAGIFFSQRRLSKLRIFCISPRTINLCGLINLVCFDKTGTLTEDGLDLKEIQPVGCTEPASFVEPNEAARRQRLFRAMAACHSLSLMSTEEEGKTHGEVMKLIGDPLDEIMFRETGWSFEEKVVSGFGQEVLRAVHQMNPTSGLREELVLAREFPFSSAQQRMGVVTFDTVKKEFEYFLKGATEKVLGLCDLKSVPFDCLDRLHQFSAKGNRVIALASKSLGSIPVAVANDIPRVELERDLKFLGLVVFENRVKPDSPAVIDELTNANIRSVMMTGDNIHTAVSVAKTCGIVKTGLRVSSVEADEHQISVKHISDHSEPLMELKALKTDSSLVGYPTFEDAELSKEETVYAISGDNLQMIKKHHVEFMPQLLLNGAVFARVSPLDKQYLVEQFQAAGYSVAMCGDGANDCGALRAAHAGISLSESEAAAAAPFTSTNQSIACVVQVLREGRCALLTFFGIFFLMATYSMCQFTSCILLYWVGQTLTDMQFLYEDLFQLTVLAIVLACTLPYHKLTRDNVPSSLKSFPALFALVGHVVLILVAQIVAFEVISRVPCTERYGANESLDSNATSSETYPRCYSYGVWTVGIFQIVILSFIFASGPPFRAPVWTNYYHLAVATVMIVFDLVCMLGPTPPLMSGIEMNSPAWIGHRFIFLGIVFGYLIAAVFFEKVILTLGVRKLVQTKLMRKFRSPTRADIEADLRDKISTVKGAGRYNEYKNSAFSHD